MAERRIAAAALLAALVLPLAACAPLPEVRTWEQWASQVITESDGEPVDLYGGQAMGGYFDGTSQSMSTADQFLNLSLGPSTIELHCRGNAPVAFLLTGIAEPVEVDCAESASVEVDGAGGLRIRTVSEDRAYWLAIARPVDEAGDCEGCEADAFVDGEPVDGAVEESPEP